MAFTSSEKQQIRAFMGFSPFYVNANPSLESSIDLVSSTYHDAETQIRNCLIKLASIDEKLLVHAEAAIAGSAEGVTIKAINSTNLLERVGRKYIKQIAVILGYNSVLTDYYKPANSLNTTNYLGFDSSRGCF